MAPRKAESWFLGIPTMRNKNRRYGFKIRNIIDSVAIDIELNDSTVTIMEI